MFFLLARIFHTRSGNGRMSRLLLVVTLAWISIFGSSVSSATVEEGPLSEIKDLIQLSCDLDLTDSMIIATANRALDSHFVLLQDFHALTNEEQTNLVDILCARVETVLKKITSENSLHNKFIINEFDPAWEKLAIESQRVAAVRDKFDRDERKAQQTALALGTEHRWFWLASLVAVASLLALFAFNKRQEVRRYLNGGRAKGLALGKVLLVLLALLCILTASLFFASDGILVDWLDRSPGTKAVARIADSAEKDAVKKAELQTRQSAQRKELDALHEKLEAEFSRVMPAKEAAPLFDRWWAYLEAVTIRRTQLKSLEQCQAKFDDDLEVIKTHEAAIATARDATEKWRRQANRLCGFIGLAITLLVAFGGVMFVRSVKHRTRKLANTCPLCLTEGKLEEGGSGDSQGLADGMVRCKAVISESPYEECDFNFPSYLRPIPKVCFPTLGFTASGKTHWLAMVYRELNQGRFPKEVEFARIRSVSCDLFDGIVSDILDSRMGPEATTQSSVLPPLVFNLNDQDPLGRSNILVNIFDYSGEVLSEVARENIQQRALTAEGYFFFLDPKKTADHQMHHLTTFREQVRKVHRLRAGQQLRLPVALCISKIDLIPHQPYARGSNVFDKFYDDLRDIGWGMDEASIKKRSDLMRRLREYIWPGWEIERQIDDLFGGRYMFFPLTPVGLNEPGEEDLSKRTIAPVGILHPLMWLLHMNGFPVLSSNK